EICPDEPLASEGQRKEREDPTLTGVREACARRAVVRFEGALRSSIDLADQPEPPGRLSDAQDIRFLGFVRRFVRSRACTKTRAQGPCCRRFEAAPLRVECGRVRVLQHVPKRGAPEQADATFEEPQQQILVLPRDAHLDSPSLGPSTTLRVSPETSALVAR